MAKQSINIETVRQLHRAGLLDEAQQGYLAILRINPRNADILHGLGIVATQKENFTDAIAYLEKAIHYQPQDPSIYLHLANVYKIQGCYPEALDLLEKTIHKFPNYAAAYNNLGTVYYAQEKFSRAIECYRQSIAKNERYADAYYNLGLALAKNQELATAIDTYQFLLQQVPDHFAARFQLANVFMQQENLAAAIHEFLTVETAQPFHFETQTNLATCYLKKGGLNSAKEHYLKALELRPADFQILFNLGVIHMEQGHLDQAIQYYQRAVRIVPDAFDAHNNLGVAFLAKQHLGFALQHFQEALRIRPDNQAIAYTVAMLQQNKTLHAAPVDYIQSLFDGYAGHYESHLLNSLAYKIPTVLYQTVKPWLHEALTILELGCGTGLCGALFKSTAKTMVGVDLSAKMLEHAAEKKIYDQLVQSEMVAFLADKNDRYDLIIAGDALVYIGELKKLFAEVYRALHEKGLFIFNAEVMDTRSFKMGPSGRFGHSQQYLNALADENHFKVLSYHKAETRLQNNTPVYGHVYVLQKNRVI